jgi:hypothetical protein
MNCPNTASSYNVVLSAFLMLFHGDGATFSAWTFMTSLFER